MSLDQCRTIDRSKTVRQRSKTLNQREQRERNCKQEAVRTRSQSNVKRRKKNPDVTVNTFNNSCMTCKTELISKKWDRGRNRGLRRPCKGHFAPVGEGPTNKIGDIGATQLHFNANVALSECLLLVPFNIIQMLLVRSGIETIPGPTNQERIPNIRAKKHTFSSHQVEIQSSIPKNDW